PPLPASSLSLHLRPPLQPPCAVASAVAGQRRHLPRLHKVELYPGLWLFCAKSHRRLPVDVKWSTAVAAVPPAAPFVVVRRLHWIRSCEENTVHHLFFAKDRRNTVAIVDQYHVALRSSSLAISFAVRRRVSVE
ncbi:Os10g0427100, partial [Oryza sativa Japonica Group]